MGTNSQHADACEAEGPSYFVLCRRASLREEEHVLELRRDPRGHLGLVVFSSLDRLVEGCGEFQPWVAVPERHLPRVMEAAGAEVILPDVVLAPEQRHTDDEEPAR